MPDQDLATAMADLRERARAANIRRAGVLAGALEALAKGELPDAQRIEAREAAHRLAGSAGTFGFPGVTRPAQDLEELFADPLATTASAAAPAAIRLALIDAALATPLADGAEALGDS